MELRNIKSFIKVAEFENFSKAAEALGYAQSTITTQIRQLEEELGAELFDRIGKRVTLSERGRAFLHYANEMMKLEAKAIEAVSDNETPTGVLRIGILESVASSFFPALMEEYFRNYPKVTVEVGLGTTLELYEQLEKGLLDVILLLDRPVYRPALQTVYSKPCAVPFFAAKDHPLAGAENISPQRLMQETLFLTEKKNNYRQAFDEITMELGVTVERMQEIANSTCVLYFTEKNFGVSLLPEYRLRSALQAGTIRLFTVEGYDLKMDVQILYHRQRWISPAMKRFTETAAEIISAIQQTAEKKSGQ